MLSEAITRTSSTTSTSPDDNRIGIDLSSSGTWGGDPASSNVGLYISEVAGQTGDHLNLAAVLNGNVVIGDLHSGSTIVGVDGSRVLAIQNGVAPTVEAGVSSVQLYAEDLDGISTLNVMRGDGNVVKIYQETALTPADSSVLPDAYDNIVKDVIDNLRDRVNELESKLQAIGLLE